MSPANEARLIYAALPLFPLNTVLFPNGVLPLRIFEPRYVDLVRRCMRESSAFGVVAIRSGQEVGANVETVDLGTAARIVDFNAMPDGLLGITCRGERKFRIQRRWRESDGLNMAEVQYLPPEETGAVPAEYWQLAELLRKLLPELGDLYARESGDFTDASWVGSRLAEILPLTLTQKVALLEMTDPLERLAQLNTALERSRA